MESQFKKTDYLIRIVDDEISVATALSMMLEAEGWKTRCFQSAFEILSQDDRYMPGCLLLDVRMPEINGLELQKQLLSRGWNLPIIFITGFADIDTAISALKQGADDFLFKPVDEDLLLEAIETSIRKHLQKTENLPSSVQVELNLRTLTDRQKKVLKEITKGLDNAQIAEKLGISERTVQGFRAVIYKKLECRNSKGLLLLMPEISRSLEKL